MDSILLHELMPLQTITYWLQKAACWILLLQMINISIDPPDIKLKKSASYQKQKQSAATDVDSVYELISEEVFDEEIPDNNEPVIEKNMGSFVLFFSKPSFLLPAPLVKHLTHSASYPSYFPVCFPETSAPPPKFSLI